MRPADRETPRARPFDRLPLPLPRPLLRPLLWAGLAVSAAALVATSGFAENHALLINASPSLPYWAVWLTRDQVPTRGDLILFDPPRSELLVRHFGVRPQPFGKRVYGLAGDVVTEQDRTFFVNGKPVAHAKELSRLGEPLPLGPTGTIPKGCYFVATEHKDGFDSRYAAIGWVCAGQIFGIGRPVL